MTTVDSKDDVLPKTLLLPLMRDGWSGRCSADEMIYNKATWCYKCPVVCDAQNEVKKKKNRTGFC
jgi:hypothetical protein